MKIKYYLIIGILGVVFADAVFAGCNKDTTTTIATAPDYTAAEDNDNAAMVIQDIKNIVNASIKRQTTYNTPNAKPSLDISDTTVGGVKDSVYIVGFGSSDSSYADNRYRRGGIKIQYDSGKCYTQGDSIDIKFQSYYINDIGITGTLYLVNVGKDTLGLCIWRANANLTLTYPNNGGAATWVSSSRIDSLKYILGVPYYSITGSASGKSRKGILYNVAINKPIYFSALPYTTGICQYFELGALTVMLPSYTVKVAYGTPLDDCYNSVTANINGTQYTFIQL